MATFKDANQVRVNLKMKLSCYSWYLSSSVLMAPNNYFVGINTSKIDNSVKKIVPNQVDGVDIKLFLE